MMKLVMTYSIGDDCTWSANEVQPFEYESAEAALVDFVEKVEKTIVQNKEHEGDSYSFEFAGQRFDFRYFTFWCSKTRQVKVSEPCIETLEEWFANKTRKRCS